MNDSAKAGPITPAAPPSGLAAGLATLTPLEQQVLIWVYLRRCTQQQVAAELRLPAVTIAQAAARGLKSLGSFLDVEYRQKVDGARPIPPMFV